jgi:mRNA interferase MazF
MPIRRGEVYFADLDPVIGHEQAGRRPVVVVSNNTLNQLPLVVMVAPGTSRLRAPMPHLGNVCVPAGEANLLRETVFLAFQARALDHSRFRGRPLGRLSQTYLDQLDQAIAWVLHLQLAP